MTFLTSACSNDEDKSVTKPIQPVNSAPTISSPDTASAPAGASYTYTLAASDADGDTVTFKASLLPTWLTFNAANGELTGTPSASDAGDYSVTLVASDGTDTTPLFLSINVFIPNFAPVITSKPANNGVVGTAYTYTLTATDEGTLENSLVGTLPSWASFDASTGKLTGTPTDVGDHQVELSVSDGELTTTQKFILVVTSVPSTVLTFDATVTFSNFGGAIADVVTNPDTTGINTSVTVGRMQKFAGEVFGGTTIVLDEPFTLSANSIFEKSRTTSSFSNQFDAENSKFTLKVWSPRQVALTFKLEGNIDDNDVERVVTHDGTGWELLSFDFTGVTGTDYSGITLIFENGVVGDAADDAANWTFYFDQLVIPTTGEGGNNGGTTTTSEVFYDDALATGLGFDSFNPDSAITYNAEVVEAGRGNVIEVVKTGATGNFYIVGPAGGFDLSSWAPSGDLVFDLNVSSLEAGVELYVKFDSGWPNVSDYKVTLPTTGEWATVRIPVADILANGNTFGDGTADVTNLVNVFVVEPTGVMTFKLDNIRLEDATGAGGGDTGGGDTGGGDTGGTPSGMNTIDFEGDGAGGTYTWTVFENDDNPALEIVANPDATGANTSDNVAKFTARQTGNPFAGVESAHGDFGPLTLDASNSTVKIMVWKSVISDVGIKFAIANGGSQGEIKVANTLVNQWEELTFDFSGFIGAVESTNIDQIIIFPDFNARSADTVSYFDNINFSGQSDGGTGSTNGSLIDFEAAVDSYTFNDFGGGQVTIVANPDVSGINTSAQVGKMLKFEEQTYGGSTLALDSPIDLADGTTFTLKVWSDRVVAVLFKLEVLNKERSVSHGGTGWEELSFDFSGDSGTGITGITLIFDLGIMGDAANNPTDWTFYFDDMSLGNTDSGGSSSGSGLTSVDFETGGAGAAYTWAVFENSDNPGLEIVANPDMSGPNTSATVAKFTARQDGNPWAGVESAHGDFGPLTIDASNSTVKIMVWKSVISDVGIKFAIASGGAQGEIKVANTLVNQWEELTFDFSGNIGAVESTNIDQIIIFPDFNARSAETVSYFDNITFSN